jgi:hypothetical protein
MKVTTGTYLALWTRGESYFALVCSIGAGILAVFIVEALFSMEEGDKYHKEYDKRQGNDEDKKEQQ